MIPEQRRTTILRLLGDQDIRGIQELADLLGVSHMTIRRDIGGLESDGLVIPVMGGVRLAGRLYSEPSHAQKLRVQMPYKRAMAGYVAGLVRDGSAIYLDAGTSTFSVLPLITDRQHLTVVTNDFAIAAHMMNFPSVELFHTGGRVDQDNQSAVGGLAAATIRELSIDLAVISSSSWDLRGISTPSSEKVPVKLAAMAAASESVLLSDTTKFGRRALFRVAELAEFSTVITDDRLPAAEADDIRGRGIGLVLCGPDHSPVDGDGQ